LLFFDQQSLLAVRGDVGRPRAVPPRHLLTARCGVNDVVSLFFVPSFFLSSSTKKQTTTAPKSSLSLLTEPARHEKKSTSEIAPLHFIIRSIFLKHDIMCFPLC